MRRQKKNDNFMIGFMIGATMPVIGYWGIQIIFDTLTSAGIMDQVSSSTFTKRMKTLSLLAICCNLLPAQVSTNKRYTNILRGVVTATFIYTACWVVYFYSGIQF